MLKGIDPLLSPELLQILRAMGHGDEIAVVDANYPASADARRLARLDGHGAPRVAQAILSIMPLDDFAPCAFRPGIAGAPERVEPIMLEFAELVRRFEPRAEITPLMGEAFYARVKAAYAIVATGERALYGNLILRKGVIGPEPRG